MINDFIFTVSKKCFRVYIVYIKRYISNVIIIIIVIIWEKGRGGGVTKGAKLSDDAFSSAAYNGYVLIKCKFYLQPYL